MKDFQVVSSQPFFLLAFVIMGLVAALCGFFSAVVGLVSALCGSSPS
jgi:F0F1-type ATP synthase assembly protein I